MDADGFDRLTRTLTHTAARRRLALGFMTGLLAAVVPTGSPAARRSPRNERRARHDASRVGRLHDEGKKHGGKKRGAKKHSGNKKKKTQPPQPDPTRGCQFDADCNGLTNAVGDALPYCCFEYGNVCSYCCPTPGRGCASDAFCCEGKICCDTKTQDCGPISHMCENRTCPASQVRADGSVRAADIVSCGPLCCDTAAGESCCNANSDVPGQPFDCCTPDEECYRGVCYGRTCPAGAAGAAVAAPDASRVVAQGLGAPCDATTPCEQIPGVNLVCCNGECVDTWMDHRHCGGCNQYCHTADRCCGGMCGCCGQHCCFGNEQHPAPYCCP